jgi:hypothetical protein
MRPNINQGMAPNNMVWSNKNNRYLVESTVDGILYIDDKRWCQWVCHADNLSVDEFDEFQEEYDAVIAKFGDHMYMMADRLMTTHREYSDWATWHISDYLFNSKAATDSCETSAEKQKKFQYNLQKYRKEFLFCTDDYIFNNEYNDINMLYGKSLILDMELKGDYLDKIWELIWMIMHENSAENITKPPESFVRKNEDVISMRKSLRKMWNDYILIDATMVKKNIDYFTYHSLHNTQTY